jgi:general secretion pathway protein G
MYRTRRKSGFTLVEILIVVIILGILAAIVIPQFTNASQDARKSNLASQCQTLKSQIELYKLQHHDTPPALQTDWTQFLQCTNDSGTLTNNANTAQSTTAYPFGPYMQATPSNPLLPSAVATTVHDGVGAAAADGSAGWTYDKNTGVIHGVIAESNNAAVFHETDDGVTDVTTGAAIP